MWGDTDLLFIQATAGRSMASLRKGLAVLVLVVAVLPNNLCAVIAAPTEAHNLKLVGAGRYRTACAVPLVLWDSRGL